MILWLRGLKSILVRDALYTIGTNSTKLGNKIIIPMIGDSNNINNIRRLMSECRNFNFTCIYSIKHKNDVEAIECKRIIITDPNIDREIETCIGGIVLNNKNILEISEDVMFLETMGLPIFGIRFGCIGEVVENKINGILKDDLNNLIIVLKSLRRDEILAMKQNSKTFALANKADLKITMEKIRLGENQTDDHFFSE